MRIPSTENILGHEIEAEINHYNTRTQRT
jgi:hypothetical protein